MSKTILIDASNSDQTRIAVTVNDKLDDFEIESNKKNSVKGDVYLAKITRVEPSLQAAFVEFGANRNGFLPLSEIHPDYFKIPSTDKDEVKKLYDKLTENNEDTEDNEQPLFKEEDEIYYWFKIKKNTQFLKEKKNEEAALKYFEKNISNLSNPSNKILYDIGNIYKKFKNYKKAIEYYSKVLSKINNDSVIFADILYRRGGAFERMGNYEKADNDLLKSLEIRPDDPYSLNYLAYSWLERNHKIDEAIQMLEKAYAGKENDPYITDSVGWGYYLIGDYQRAEKYLRRAVELMPEDPIVNDHYGDVLWQLNRKMQASYFWKNVLSFEDTDEDIKKNIQLKMIDGVTNS